MKSLWISFKILWKYHKGSLSLLMFLKILMGLLPIAGIWLAQQLVNEIVTLKKGADLSGFFFLFTLQVLVLLFSFILQQLNQIKDRKLEYSFRLTIKKRIFDKIQRLPYITFEDPRFFNQFQRLNSGQSKILLMIREGMNFTKGIITLSGVLLLLITINWWLIPILVIGVCPLFIIQMKFGSRRYFLARELTPYSRKEHYTADLLERREPLKEVKLFGLEGFLIERWKKFYQLNVNQNLSMYKKQSFWLTMAQVLLMVTYAASGILVISMIVTGRIMVGSFVAVLQAVERVQNALNGIAQSLSSFYEASFFIEELRSFFHLKERDVKKITHTIEHFRTLDVLNLAFTYPGAEKPTIEDISFSITPGKKVAIIGENGSGKTTLIKCLTGLYDSKNKIRINGIPLEQVDLKSYHDRIAVLFQDYNKYFFTAQENIGFGRVNELHNLSEIQRAAKKVGIDNHFQSFNSRYNTALGRLFEGGTDLSGGQWQKVALARSIFRKGDMIILDEPTASLDPKSEVDIIEDLFRTVNEQSILFITHRLGAASLADEILVMKNGNIFERGSHQELLKLDGEYRKMFEAQSKWYSNLERGEAPLWSTL